MTERGTVVLVDEEGVEQGVADKLGAHRAPGRLHLAFSVFLFSGPSLLLQRRARSKYHFPGIWANTCCSHPLPGEDLLLSAELRLAEELGITSGVQGVSQGGRLVVRGVLEDLGTFVYRAVDPTSGLVEHEFDHVLAAVAETPGGGAAGPTDLPDADPAEVDETRWVPVAEVRGYGADEGFAPWFAQALEIVLAAGYPR